MEDELAKGKGCKSTKCQKLAMHVCCWQLPLLLILLLTFLLQLLFGKININRIGKSLLLLVFLSFYFYSGI